MFLGVYHFDGDTTALLTSYDRLLARFPPNSFDLHACIRRSDGISVYDACPDRSTFEKFSSGPEFHDTIHSVGLPSPRVEQLGEVYAARVRGGQVLT